MPTARSTSPSGGNGTPPPPEPELVAELARTKRKVSVLEDDLKKARGLAKKRPVTTVGRGIPKVVSLFVDLPTLVHEADRREEAAMFGALDRLVTDEEDGDLAEEEKAERDRTRNRNFTSYLALNALVPGFKKTIDQLSSEELADYYTRLGDGCTDARGDDIFSMISGMADFLNKAGATPPLDPGSREGRGREHELCGQLLCPIEWDWADPAVRANIQNAHGNYDASNRFFLRGFYAGFKGDENDLEKGLLMSPLLVKAFKFLFTSPNSAKDVVLIPADDAHTLDNPPAKKRKTKAPITGTVASRLHMEEVTPRALAYVCVMVVFSLTDAPHWDASYDGFNYRGLYNFVIGFFEDAETPEDKQRVKTLLQWWNKQIFPHASSSTNNSSGNASYTKLAAQRHARAAGRPVA
ncbi:uncharacterized protein STEHIDRAFT_109013 [Stereum hirsutum FP-91666 SS1]|uniref:uncharacterized protein n=1 Tax=Stereum hirsutum (strain FP-91666) TaxID=721885 RepID=UPI000440E898|nr:uncharacterized protein STEHIDRAFT_109013 [Stereum hirsutum FP-91666 SS1]EIM90541.1 hypothetical protein STEHIDRAFT_109013 [Stereum hirsutum FP-91666 SS1]